jgi:Flp pilus assembly protein TadG
MQWFRSLRRRQRGQGLIEFVVALPVAVFLLLAIVEMGLHFYTRVTARHAIQEAARYAVTGQQITDPLTGQPIGRAASIIQTLQDKATALNIDVSDISLNPPDGGGPDDVVEISLTYTYEFGPAIAPLFVSRFMDITLQTTVKNEPLF